jgi:diguanylate cyclase (GGDEF)-like protein/PAS domain S-box-containing protein
VGSKESIMARTLVPSGLRTRLMLLIAFIVGSSSALLVYQAAQHREAAIRGAASEAVLLSRLAAAQEARSVAVARQLLHDLAAAREVRSGSGQAAQRLLDRLRDRPASVRSIAVTDRWGRVLACTEARDRGAVYLGARWFREAAAARDVSVSPLESLAGEESGGLRCAAAVLDARGCLVAVVSAELDHDWLRRAAARARLPGHTSFLIVDREGDVVALHPAPAPGRPDSTVTLPRGAAGEWMQRVRGGDGRPRIVAFSPLESGRRGALHVGAGIDEPAVVAEARRGDLRSLAVMLLLGTLVSLLAWYGVKKAVLRRIDALRAAMDRLQAGDFTARTGVRHGRGELARLARAFDEMAKELQYHSEERARTEAQLRASEAHKSAVLESSLDGILVLDGTGRALECNAAARRLFGCEGRHCVHHRIGQLFADYPPPAGLAGQSAATPVEATAQRMDGSRFPAEVAVAPIRDPAGWGQFVATVRDLTERKRWERSIEALTFVDDLTGLYNRRGFSMFALQQIRLAARTGQNLVLVSVDLDGLKRINDSFGHNEGDRAIHELAVILRRGFRETDVIARFGGDEFVVLATENEGLGAESTLERLAERMSLRNRRGDLPWTLSASFGWTRIDPRNAPPLQELLAIADARMYEAKRASHGAAGAPGPAVPLPGSFHASLCES